MSDDVKTCGIVMGALLLFAIALIGGFTLYNVTDRLATEREAIEAIRHGYTREMLPGARMPEWVRR